MRPVHFGSCEGWTGLRVPRYYLKRWPFLWVGDSPSMEADGPGTVKVWCLGGIRSREKAIARGQEIWLRTVKP